MRGEFTVRVKPDGRFVEIEGDDEVSEPMELDEFLAHLEATS